MKFSRGPVVVLVFVLLAVAALAGNVWFQVARRAKSTAWWGSEQAWRIAQGQPVELLDAVGSDQEADASGEIATIALADGATWQATVHEVTSAPGLSNIRRLLLDETMLDWQPADQPPVWEAALRFHDDTAATVVLLSFDPPCVGTPQRTETLSNRPCTAAIRAFVEQRRRERAGDAQNSGN